MYDMSALRVESLFLICSSGHQKFVEWVFVFQTVFVFFYIDMYVHCVSMWRRNNEFLQHFFLNFMLQKSKMK